ncbi:MAG: hypothetical protein ACI9MF_000568 [Gammaproteobacteria bacterium]|jgi:hypothetical protein
MKIEIMKPFNLFRLVFFIALFFSLSGCDQSLTMVAETDVPIPLAIKLPLTMGVYYDDKFRNYIYEEDSEDRPKWAINSGASQVELFDRVLPSMFQDISYVESTAGGQGNVDGILVPEVEEMQFALPRETKSDLYEVWIKYKVKLLAANGDLVADWPVTGYGKSSIEFLKSRDKGLQAAINSAFRDAGAKFSLTFTKVPPIREWLANKPEVCKSHVTDIC